MEEKGKPASQLRILPRFSLIKFLASCTPYDIVSLREFCSCCRGGRLHLPRHFCHCAPEFFLVAAALFHQNNNNNKNNKPEIKKKKKTRENLRRQTRTFILI